MTGHDFPPDAWRCSKCGARVGSIDAKLGCLVADPPDVATLPCDTEPMEADPSPYDLMP